MSIADSWRVETLRFTLFRPADVKFQASGLWEKIVGNSPTNRTERPQQGLTIEEGIWEDRQLTVTVQPERLDVLMSSVPSSLPSLPDLGKFATAEAAFIRVLPNLPVESVTRVAFGVVLLHPTADHAEAYRQLAAFLPEIEIKPEWSDFLYQINKPTNSKIDPEIVINRLNRWSAISMQILNLSNTNQLNKVQLFAVRHELDISTKPEKELSSKHDIPRQLTELVDEAFAIAGRSEHE